MCIDKFLDDLAFYANPYLEMELTRDYIDSINDYMMEATIIHNNNEEYRINYPVINKEDELAIRNIILNEKYPEELIPLIDKLEEHLGIEFLLFCVLNIKTIKLVKDKKFKHKKFAFNLNYTTGAYIPEDNKILYYENETIPHEFIHMSSTPLLKMTKDEYYSGFRFDYGARAYQKGLNEGYTELLTRRIFYNENYNSDTAYKPIVYILRIFELLYADKKYMERDYFLANYQSPIGNFVKYGSVEEYFKLMKYLDYFANTAVFYNEDVKVFKFLKEIIERTYDEDKILEAEKIEEEYFKEEEKAPQKIFSLFK